MAETNKVEPTTNNMGAAAATAPMPASPAPGGLRFYARGGWLFFKKMWPALYDLSTTETYVNASAIAFNVLLSFFSFVVLIGSFLLNVLQWQRGYQTSFRLMMSLAPKESGDLFKSLDVVTRGPGGKATLISFGLLIYSASGIFQPLEAALNRAWGFKERDFIKQYATYLSLAVVCAAIMLAPIALGSLYDFGIEKVFGLFGASVNDVWRKYIFYVIGPPIALPFVALLFFVIYYFVPNGKVQASQTAFTSIATALLWFIAMFVFWLALPLFDFEESYKKLASLMALVTWIFFSSFILILGANLSAHKVLPESWTGYLPFRRSAAIPGAEVQKRS
ncbi:MAG TPA: YihY/virulence factor BrkB family protein [Blastocatellia bacterium]|nr:YihY/virulence factor BrkB family protein [Blastocatellia bacterium]HKE02477.1 YihY/virulence factor BrkB family protein [Blastocatellia bacterium]